MTKLSDALRGAADRAPVSDVGISSDVAARRVARQRGMRGAANGLVGVGAVTVLTLGVMSPGLGIFPGGDSASMADGPADMEAATAEGGFGREDLLSFSDMAYCGYPASIDSSWGESTVEYTAELAGNLEVEGGDFIDVAITLTALTDTDLSTGGPQVMVLWDGLVVGQVTPGSQLNTFSLLEGETVNTAENVALVNCWDGAPLPAGEYELLVSQMFIGSEAELIVPEEPAADEPIIEIPSPQADGEVTDSAVDDSGLETPQELTTAPSEFLVLAEPMSLAIDGELLENPFEDYLFGELEPIDLPDNYLTPEIARALYNDTVQDGVWNMEPGTQRWVMQNGLDQQFDDNAWERNYFGCSWDGELGNTFPAQSADLGLLEVTTSLPSLLNISYGWVVDGNPAFSVSVSNTSEYAIPGFYGQPSAQLYLVQNGRVVAESYGVNVDPAADYGLWEDGAEYNALQHLGLLEPDQTLSGDFLWREVQGCWTETGGPSLVEPGTYTVLSAQYVHVSSGDEYMGYYGGYDDVMYDDGDFSSSAPTPETSYLGGDMEIMPYPGGDYDWVELVVWNSLGTVTLTD